jgi:hypothetical protein
MGIPSNPTPEPDDIHPWLRKVRVAFVPGIDPSPLVSAAIANLLDSFADLGHVIQQKPDDLTDILLTTAPFGIPIPWRKSLLFTGRMRFKLSHSPTVYTLIHVDPKALDELLLALGRAVAKVEPDPADFQFSGISSTAYRVLYKQGQRGGAILALERLLQAQAKSIHILLLVGENKPEAIYHFDLVGAYPTSSNPDMQALFRDVALRMVTTVSTREVVEHQTLDKKIPYSLWSQLKTPQEMIHAAQQLGKRDFFTDMIRIQDLVSVPAVSDAVSSQYSEGCFATWDLDLNALIATITGSARPVEKGNIIEADLAVIAGIRPDRKGVIVQHVEGKQNYPPSSEALEMIGMDELLPKITLPLASSGTQRAPVIRSKLHGHRGIRSYNPKQVEFVPLDPPYYLYPVSCATEAQAQGIIRAFGRSKALEDPSDPRQIVFSILPTHGVVIVEKWVPNKAPFQIIWEALDTGDLVIDRLVPQGKVEFHLEANAMVLERQ